METGTPFDLNCVIRRWREHYGSSPAFAQEDLDELEAHLHDSMDVLQKQGLSSEESFLVATNRIGKDAALEKEFGKINQRKVWLDRVLWMLIGVQVWGLVSNVLSRFVGGAVSLGLGATNYDFVAHGRAIPVTLLLFVQAAAFIGSLTFCWWLVVRKGPGLGAWFGRHVRRRGHLALTCGLLWLFSMVASTLCVGFQILPLKSFDVNFVGELSTSLAISTAILTVIQGLAMIAVTLCLARERMRLEAA